MTRKRVLGLSLVLVAMLMLGGCNAGNPFQPANGEKEQPLIKAEVVFTDGKTLVTYLKTMGIEESGRVYVGGSSSTNMYNAQGDVIGTINYQHVQYIKVLPAKPETSDTSKQ